MKSGLCPSTIWSRHKPAARRGRALPSVREVDDDVSFWCRRFSPLDFVVSLLQLSRCQLFSPVCRCGRVSQTELQSRAINPLWAGNTYHHTCLLYISYICIICFVTLSQICQIVLPLNVKKHDNPVIIWVCCTSVSSHKQLYIYHEERWCNSSTTSTVHCRFVDSHTAHFYPQKQRDVLFSGIIASGS